MTHILVATDAWHPQVNGVVRTLIAMAEAAKGFGVEVSFLTPQSFRTFAMPSYPDLRLALPGRANIARLIDAGLAGHREGDYIQRPRFIGIGEFGLQVASIIGAARVVRIPR